MWKLHLGMLSYKSIAKESNTWNTYVKSYSSQWGLQGENDKLEFHIMLENVMGFMTSAPFQQST